MGRILVFLVGLSFISFNGMAFSAKATFSTTNNSKIQVYLDGQLVNKEPKNQLRLKTSPGSYEVTFKVFDEDGNVSMECYDELRLSEGFNSNYKLCMEESEALLQIKKTGMDKLYSRNYKAPHHFYNKRNIAAITPYVNENTLQGLSFLIERSGSQAVS